MRARRPACTILRRCLSGRCSRCGAVLPDVVHVPEGREGFFCPACCPVCRKETKTTSA